MAEVSGERWEERWERVEKREGGEERGWRGEDSQLYWARHGKQAIHVKC